MPPLGSGGGGAGMDGGAAIYYQVPRVGRRLADTQRSYAMLHADTQHAKKECTVLLPATAQSELIHTTNVGYSILNREPQKFTLSLRKDLPIEKGWFLVGRLLGFTNRPLKEANTTHA
jgi:hypothetical protein